MEETSNQKQLQTEAENEWYKRASLLGDSFFVVIKKRKNRDEIFVSETVDKIIGLNEQQLIEQKGKIFSLIHHDDAVKVIKQNNEFLFSKNNTAEFHYRILFQGKTEKWIQERISVERNKTGAVTSSFSLFTDVTNFFKQITELKKTESVLRDTCEGKDKFINILSHDLRAPFTSILGFAEILINEPDLSLKDKNEYLNYILEASQMLLMTDLQFVESTKKENGCMQFPIIIMLHISELEQRQAYILQGVKHFVHLPLQEEELLYTLKSTLN